jgi:hypothetical protein
MSHIPNLMPPFTKGDPRINRKGRLDVKRGQIHYVDLLRKYLSWTPMHLRDFLQMEEGQDSKEYTWKQLRRRDVKNIEMMAARAVLNAMTGSVKDPRLLENMLDRVWGRPAQPLQHSGIAPPEKIVLEVIDAVANDRHDDAALPAPGAVSDK